MTSDGLNRECSDDSLFDGHLYCSQHLKGYRFSQDSILLAHSFTPSPEERILDLGTGCGIIALILAYLWPSLHISALEIQPDLLELARYNVKRNNFANRVQAVGGDLKEVQGLFGPGSFDRVVCNPPYRPVGAARPNPDPEQAMARHELLASLEDIIISLDWLLVAGGRADFVYPADRADELMDKLNRHGLTPFCLQEVFSYPGGTCRLVLVEAVKGGKSDLEVKSPLFVQKGPGGEYTPEMAGFYKK